MPSDDPAPEKPKRVVGRPFQKGVSPNPGGKPKRGPPVLATSGTVDDAIVKAGPTAVALLVAVMNDRDEATRDRITAASKILDKLKPNAVPIEKPNAAEQEKIAGIEALVDAIAATPPEGGDETD
jgi:beta-lactamase class A